MFQRPNTIVRSFKVGDLFDTDAKLAVGNCGVGEQSILYVVEGESAPVSDFLAFDVLGDLVGNECVDKLRAIE